MECISYKEKYLPNLNIAPVYLSLAKIYHNWSKKDKVMEVTEKALQEPDLRPEQIVQVWSYRCLAAYVDDEKTEEFNRYYAELEKVRKETGISTNLSQRADIYHAEINGDYEKMLALAQNMASPLDRMSTTARAYKMLGRWEDAYYLQVDYKNYSDSINSAELRNLTLNHSLALDAARAENEAKELKLENQQLQLELLYMLAIIAILVIASLAFILYRISTPRRLKPPTTNSRMPTTSWKRPPPPRSASRVSCASPATFRCRWYHRPSQSVATWTSMR